jgi:hypothetical protein
MTMYVWRLAPEDAYSDVQATRREAIRYVQAFQQNPHPNLAPYANCNFAPVSVGHCRNWAVDQIFQHHLVRQGWCGVGLDLRQGRDAWIQNWRLLDPTYTYQAAGDRYDRLSPILAIRAGDIIFLPRVPDWHRFTVVTVAEPYYFEDRSRFTQFWELDFGHVIPIDGNIIRTFPYGPQTLEARAFQPYQSCVSRVTCSNNSGFGPFLRSQNYPFTPY